MRPNLVADVIDRIYDVITFFQNTFILGRSGVAIFVDIIKILTMFFITIYKDSGKVKINRNHVTKYNRYMYFLIKQNLLISGEKILISAELKRSVIWFIYFWIFFGWDITVPSFFIVGYVWQILERGGFLPTPPAPSPSVSSNQKSHLNRVEIKNSNKGKLLGIKIDKNLTFKKHIRELCWRPSYKLLTLRRIRKYLTVEKAKLLANSCINSQFNYAPLIWMFANKCSIDKILKIQKKNTSNSLWRLRWIIWKPIKQKWRYFETSKTPAILGYWSL